MDRTTTLTAVDLIRQTFLYADRFRDATFVLHIDDALFDHPLLPSLIGDVALLRRIGIAIVIVVDADIRSQRHDGIHIVSHEALPSVQIAAFNAANRLLTLLSTEQVWAVIGNWVRARALGVRDGLDFQQSAELDRIDVASLQALLEHRLTPIFPPIGWSATGRIYHLSSRQMAGRIAVDLRAAKLFFIVADAIETEEGGLLSSRMTPAETAERLSRHAKDDDNDILQSLWAACDAVQAGVSRVHLVDGRIEGVLLREIFTNLGAGTMIHANIYHNIRPMERGDVVGVLRIMRPLVERRLILPRSREELLEQISSYIVYETDGAIHGCAALFPLTEETGEIAAVSVDSDYKKMGIGGKMVGYLIEQAQKQGLHRIVALTTGATDWFERLGFRIGTPEQLPPDRRERYDHSRSSRVLILDRDQ